MGRAALLACWAWSLAALALDVALDAPRLGPGVSRTGLVLLPWLALAGLPRGKPRVAPDSAAPGLRSLAPLLMAAPLVALSVRVDLSSGASAAALSAAVGGAVALLCLASIASAWARGPAYGALWVTWTLALPLLYGALAWTAGPALGEAPAGRLVARAAGASPLGWLHAWTRADALPAVSFPFAGVAAALVLVAVARGGGARPAGPAPGRER